MGFLKEDCRGHFLSGIINHVTETQKEEIDESPQFSQEEAVSGGGCFELLLLADNWEMKDLFGLTVS